METILRDLCADHKLTTISIMLQASYGNHINVYLHWRTDECDDVCVSGYGKTFDEAFAMACEDMRARRPAPAVRVGEAA